MDAFAASRRSYREVHSSATGGTMAAACRMVEELSGNIVGVAFLVELDFLNGRVKLQDYPLHVLVHYLSEAPEK